MQAHDLLLLGRFDLRQPFMFRALADRLVEKAPLHSCGLYQPPLVSVQRRKAVRRGHRPYPIGMAVFLTHSRKLTAQSGTAEWLASFKGDKPSPSPTRDGQHSLGALASPPCRRGGYSGQTGGADRSKRPVPNGSSTARKPSARSACNRSACNRPRTKTRRCVARQSVGTGGAGSRARCILVTV